MKPITLFLLLSLCIGKFASASGLCDGLAAPVNLDVIIFAPDDAKMTWDEIPAAKGYQIQFTKIGSWFNSQTVPDPKKRAYPLEPGASYEFRVRGICEDSTITPYSPWFGFTMPNDTTTPTVNQCDTLPIPTNLTADIIAIDEAKLKWDEVAGAKGYQLQMQKIDGWSNSKSVPEAKKRAYPLEPGASYQYRVKAICSDSSITGNSPWFGFTMPTDTVSPPVWVCGDDYLDDRDGKVYGTVQIGGQCWFSDNLNYDPGTGESGYQQAQNPANSQEYGGYYYWTTAKQIDSFWLADFYAPEGEQGVCPTGWHVPTDSDWVELLSYPGIDGNSIAVGGSSGFNLVMSGYISTTGSYQVEGLGTILISSSENSKQRMWAYIVSSGSPLIERGGIVKPCRGPLRCLKDD